jgi:hypothetical protein
MMFRPYEGCAVLDALEPVGLRYGLQIDRRSALNHYQSNGLNALNAD